MSNYSKTTAILQPVKYIGSLEQINQLILQKSPLIPCAEYSLQDIGTMCGLSRERIRQIESNAINKIKRLMLIPQNKNIRQDLYDYSKEGTRCMLDIAQMQHDNTASISTNKSRMEQNHIW